MKPVRGYRTYTGSFQAWNNNTDYKQVLHTHSITLEKVIRKKGDKHFRLIVRNRYIPENELRLFALRVFGFTSYKPSKQRKKERDARYYSKHKEEINRKNRERRRKQK